MILQGPLPFELPLIRSVATPREARIAVDDLRRAGVDFIKVGDTVPPEAYRALADRVRQHGLRLRATFLSVSAPPRRPWPANAAVLLVRVIPRRLRVH